MILILNMFFINKSSRYFLILLVQSGATLAHRAMQRGPCKSRVTVTSAHAVLFQYNDIALHHNYVANFRRATVSIASQIQTTCIRFIIEEEQSLSNNVKYYVL